MESAARRARAVGLDPGGGVPARSPRGSTRAPRCSTACSRARGREIGAIVTAGQEDYLRIERGIQTYLGYSYSDRLHLATHYHNEPLVPRERMKGVRGRIDVFGAEVAAAARGRTRARPPPSCSTPASRGSASACCSATATPSTSCASARSSRRSRRSAGVDGEVPVFLSSELYPLRRDFPRLNSTLIEAYAAEPSRGSAADGPRRDEGGGRRRSSCGSWPRTAARSRSRRKELATTLVSGPIGGVVGGQALAERIGARRTSLCTDIGGTSFDIALITDGRFEITPTPDIARFMLNMPLVQIDSIGAGTGSFVRVNPNSGRPELGPDSAGARIGVCWPEGGLETVSVTDLNLVLGPRQSRLLPRRRRQARPRARARRGRAPGRRAARARGRGRRRRGDRAVRADAQERGRRADPRQGLLARRLRAALLRRRRAAARRRLHRGRRLPRRAGARVGGRASPPTAARAPTSSTATTRRSTCRSCRPPTTWRRRAIGMMVTGGWQGLRGAGRGRVREVRGRARRDRLHPRGADAVLRPAQRHRDRLPAHGDRGGRARRRPDRRRSRTPTARSTRARPARPSSATWSPRRSSTARSRSRSRRCPSSPSARATPPVKAHAHGAVARRRRRDLDLYELDDVEAGHAITGPGDRRVARRRRSRSRRGGRRGSTPTASSTSRRSRSGGG